MTHEETIEFYVSELRILKADLGSEDRFFAHIAKQLIDLDQSMAENEKLRQAFISHAERMTVTANEYLRKK